MAFGTQKSPLPVAVGIQRVEKASQSLQSWAANKIKIIFCRGVYLTENTSQAASVEFVRQGRINSARGRLQKNCRKSPQGFSDSLNPHCQ